MRLRFADAPTRLEGDDGASPNTVITTGAGGGADPASGLWTSGKRLLETYPPGSYFLMTLPSGRVQLWRMDDTPTLDLGQATGTTADAARARLRQASRVQAARDAAILKRMNARAAEMWRRP